MVGMEQLVVALDTKFRRDDRRLARVWMQVRELEERVERAESGLGRVVMFFNRMYEYWSYLVVR